MRGGAYSWARTAVVLPSSSVHVRAEARRCGLAGAWVVCEGAAGGVTGANLSHTAGSPSMAVTEANAVVGGMGALTNGFAWLQADIWAPSGFSPTYSGYSTGWSAVLGLSY